MYELESKFIYTSELLKEIFIKTITSNLKITIYSINLNTMYLYATDAIFKKEFSKADYYLFDGIAAIFWAKREGIAKKIEKLGADAAMKLIFQWSETYKWSIYIIGGSINTINKFKNNLKSSYKNIIIKGHSHGYFSTQENTKILGIVKNNNPNILLVGLSVPKEYLWTNEFLGALQTNVIFTCGGYIEQTAEKGINYYPYEFITRFHLNWLYRIYKEPKRLAPRYIQQIIWYLINYKNIKSHYKSMH